MFDELIQNNIKRIKLLEQMAENLYKEWFVRFRFPGYETMEFEVKSPKGWIFGDKEVTSIPSNWHYGELKEIGEFIRGKNITADKMIEGEVPVISAGISPSGYHNVPNVFAKDDNKEKFKVILNTLTNLYEASKPEIFEKDWYNEKFSPLVYLHGLFYKTIDDAKVNRARKRMQQLLDGSVSASESFISMVREEPAQYMIHKSKVIDLSKIDTEQLRKEIKTAKYKAIEIDDLKEFIEKALQQMLNKNCTRTKFSERYKRIIDSYNAGGTENEDYYEQLVKLVQELKEEDNRAVTEGLLEEELEIYDLLVAGKKLTKADEQKVKLSAKNLFHKLMENKKELLPPTITFSLSDNSNSIKLFFFIQRRSSDNLIDLIFSDGLCDGLLSFSYIILSGSLPASSNPLNELRHRKYWCGLFI